MMDISFPLHFKIACKTRSDTKFKLTDKIFTSCFPNFVIHAATLRLPLYTFNYLSLYFYLTNREQGTGMIWTATEQTFGELKTAEIIFITRSLLPTRSVCYISTRTSILTIARYKLEAYVLYQWQFVTGTIHSFRSPPQSLVLPYLINMLTVNLK